MSEQLPLERSTSNSVVQVPPPTSRVGTFVVENGRIAHANTQLAELLGFDISDILGHSPLEFAAPSDRTHIEEFTRHRCSCEGEDRCVETRWLRADGSIVALLLVQTWLSLSGKSLNAVAAIDLTACKRAEQESEDRLRFERLLADISADFVNLPVDQIDLRFDASLKTIVELLGSDRCTFIEFGEDDEHVLVTHSFAVAGCAPSPLGPFPVKRLPWFIGQFRGGNVVVVRNPAHDLPPEAVEEREYCLAHGIQSKVTLPLKVGGVLLGGLTFAYLREPCKWPSDMIGRLQLIREVFANALLRRRMESSLRSALAENQTLHRQLAQESLYLREEVILKHHHGRIIGHSDAIVRVLAAAERVAPTSAPVLVLGETGTGKELLAQTIHELSDRKQRPMVIVNCACLPATLIESELFGREAGAYTGAASAEIGRFKLADGSTLFLDEIGEFPLELQAKMLRVLQDGRFERLGSSQTITVDVRLIAATNRDLRQAVRDGKFRADLYHRLNVFPIELPPLRQRREDIPALVWSFVEAIGRRMGKTITCIPRRSMQQLERYSWPGNVRELSNVVERALILTTDDTLRIEMPVAVCDDLEPRRSLKDCEREQILRILQDTGWRIRGTGGAAEILDIKPTTLEARIAKLGIKRPSRNHDQA